MITQQRLHTLVTYCHETGQFWWRVRRGPRAAGAVAGGDHFVGKIRYREIRIEGVLNYGHRLAWVYIHGDVLMPGDEIDHVDGDGTNNKMENLRLVSSSGNKQNMSKRSDNTSGVVGVHWHRGGAKWAASICLKGTPKHLGLFDVFQDAVDARKKAEETLGFHPNHGRVRPSNNQD